MRDYGKVHTSFWTSETIRGMSEDARALSMYLMTCPHGNIAGAFRIPDGYVCDDLQWSMDRVRKGFSELLAKGFAKRCERTKWAWVVKHFTWNQPENPNQRKAAAKIVAKIPDECSWKREFMRSCWPFFMDSEPVIEDGSETVDEPFLNQEQEQEQEQYQEQKQEQTIVEQQAARPSANEDVSRVFAYWQSIMGTNRAVLDQKRKKVIQVMLKAGYSADDLCKAIRGCSKSAFHMGQNENGAKYNGLDLICRNAEYVDRFMAYDDSPPVPKGKQATIESINRAAGDAFLNDGRDIFGPGPIIEGECSHA